MRVLSGRELIRALCLWPLAFFYVLSFNEMSASANEHSAMITRLKYLISCDSSQVSEASPHQQRRRKHHSNQHQGIFLRSRVHSTIEKTVYKPRHAHLTYSGTRPSSISSNSPARISLLYSGIARHSPKARKRCKIAFFGRTFAGLTQRPTEILLWQANMTLFQILAP